MTGTCKWLALLLLLSFTPPVSAADDPPEWLAAKIEDMEVKARLVRDPKQITGILGNDLDGDFILIEMDLKPLLGAKIELKRDDFLMRTYRNNDTSTAQSPHRIAGDSELVLGKGETISVGIYSQSTSGIPVGGMPGTGTRPRRIGGNEPQSGGSLGSQGSSEISQRNSAQGEDLLSRLEALELPLGEVDDVVHGYLYFQLSPKERPKNLTLNYDGTAGKWQIRFGE
jgi:hypothetical protein